MLSWCWLTLIQHLIPSDAFGLHRSGKRLFHGVVSPKFSPKNMVIFHFHDGMLQGPVGEVWKTISRMVELRSNLRKFQMRTENLPRNLRSKRHWIWRDDMTNLIVLYYSFVLGSSRRLVEISGGFGEFCDVHIRFGEVFNNTSRDSRARGFKCLQWWYSTIFGDV